MIRGGAAPLEATDDGRRGRRRGIYLLGLLAGLLATPIAISAQAGVTILGTVSDADSDAAVESAFVTLTGLGSTMTTPEGTFRFRGIAPGEYLLRVEALGYEALEFTLDLASDTTLTLTLEAAPLPIDGIVVEAGTLDFEGRVRDVARDFTVVDAEVVMDGRPPVWTDSHGRFDLDDVAEGAPLHLTIRSFGYLPIDTTFVPDDEERYEFDLERDAFAEAMMALQVERIEERAGGRAMTGWAGLDREAILRYTGSHTARTMLEFNFPARIRGRIRCYYIDERRIDGAYGFGREIAEMALGHTLPEEIHHVELLVFDNVLGRPIMAHLYTRSFIMALATGEAQLRTSLAISPTSGCIG